MACDPYQRANRSMLKTLQARWHQQESKRHILRSQVGFTLATSQTPLPCAGCVHYHGKAYGTEQRIRLICAIHPYGWMQMSACPDWEGAALASDG
ncbi:hypothetical protein GS597_02320 [Synechococcales cyanobacterium C]|uniref:Uncharacterized protein n=1 Tax=Petrachloros mirabilis ULC683 TaxID=2781853 RepID=A0A8K1ZWJ1_9CYAN|nr:hypothetical protein [Petrachloros mirabilis]NCJ05366.1 hypothetical protein [Petrachloros mirabilis ULC683]